MFEKKVQCHKCWLSLVSKCTIQVSFLWICENLKFTFFPTVSLSPGITDHIQWIPSETPEKSLVYSFDIVENVLGWDVSCFLRFITSESWTQIHNVTKMYVLVSMCGCLRIFRAELRCNFYWILVLGYIVNHVMLSS